MAKMNLAELSARLSGALIDIPKPSTKTKEFAAYVSGGLACALTSIAMTAYQFESLNERVNIDLLENKEAMVTGLSIMRDATKSLEGNNFRSISTWEQAKMAYRDSRIAPILVDGWQPGVEAIFITNPSQLLGETGALDRFQKQVAEEFSESQVVIDNVQEHYLDKFPNQIRRFVEHSIRNSKVSRGTAALPLKTESDPIFIGVTHMANYDKPISERINSEDVHYQKYHGPLVDISLAESLNMQERIEISATFKLMKELNRNFALNAPYAFNNSYISKLFVQNDDAETRNTLHYGTANALSSRLISSGVSDAMALIEGAKALRPQAWESLKLDVLSQANIDQYIRGRNVSNDVLADASNFAIKPFIKFLDNYRINPENYPSFEAATSTNLETAIFVTNVVAEANARGESIADKLMFGVQPQRIVQDLEAEMSEAIDQLLTDKKIREQIADATIEANDAYKFGM